MASFRRDPRKRGVEYGWGMKIAILGQYLALSRKGYKIGP